MAKRKRPQNRVAAGMPPAEAKRPTARKRWTDREVLDLIRVVLAVRDVGLMRRMQNVWAGGESASLSPLSEFFGKQPSRFDPFDVWHDADKKFWQPLASALRERARPAERRALTRAVAAMLCRAEAVADGRADVRLGTDQENQAWLRWELEDLGGGGRA